MQFLCIDSVTDGQIENKDEYGSSHRRISKTHISNIFLITFGILVHFNLGILFLFTIITGIISTSINLLHF